MIKSAWSKGDRRRFADRNILRASKRPGRRSTGPKADEWYEEAKER